MKRVKKTRNKSLTPTIENHFEFRFTNIRPGLTERVCQAVSDVIMYITVQLNRKRIELNFSTILFEFHF